MAEERSAYGAVGGKAVDLAGDSPELIAFALLRYLAQLEQQNDDIVFDRAWMLDGCGAWCVTTTVGPACGWASRPSNHRRETVWSASVCCAVSTPSAERITR